MGMLSIDEINQLQGSYNAVVKQNKSLQSEIGKLQQKFDEISAGVLMIAEIMGLEVPKHANANEMISQIAAIIEEQRQNAESEYQSSYNNIEKSISGIIGDFDNDCKR